MASTGSGERTLLARMARFFGISADPVAELPAGVAFEASRFSEGSEEHRGLFVGLFLDPVAAAELAIEGGQPAEMLHVTLCYVADAALDELGLARAIVAIDDVCGWRAPLAGKVAGYGRFGGSTTSDGLDIFHAIPDVVGLAELRDDVAEQLSYRGIRCDQGPHGWAPHITLAKVASGAPNPVEALPATLLRFDVVTVAFGDRMVRLPMRGFGPGVAYGETVVGEGPKGPRLFSDTGFDSESFAEPPEWIPILPAPGVYEHRVYGRIEITPELVAEVMQNFDDRVYGQDVPLDTEHAFKPAGSMGYLQELKKREDGGVSGKVEWTDIGAELIRRDRFKYCSAELIDYKSPLDLTVTPNVLSGVALTTRPFFKENVLPRLVASEDASQTATAAPAVATTPPAIGGQEVIGMSNTDPKDTTGQGGAKLEMSEEVARKFADLEREVAAAKAESTAKDAQVTQLSERVTKQEDEARERRFGAEVDGHVEGGVRWIGDRTKHLGYLEKLAKAFGEESDEVKHYVAEQRTHSEQMRKSKLFAEFGGDGEGGQGGQGDAWEQIEAEATKLRASERGLTKAGSIARILQTQPELAKRYNEESREKR